LQCHIDDFNDFKDIEKLPFINKEIVKENYHNLIAHTYPKKNTFFVTTGGSSGEPMQFLQSKNVWNKELAFVNHFFKEYGYNPNKLKASFRGGEFHDLKPNTYWKLNPVHNEIHFSPFHMNQKTIAFYLDAMNTFQPKFIHGYPSAILTIIENLKHNNLKVTYQIDAIFLISENFSKDDLEYISHFFNCKVTSFFGHSERLIFTPLNKNQMDEYDIQKRYGYVELIDKKQNIIKNSHTLGELVGTSFDNFAMPLIRYKTEDFTSYTNKELHSLKLIQGRWDKEYLEGKNGLKLTLTALNMHSDIFDNVIHFQFLQTTLAKVTLLLVVKSNYTMQNETKILQALNQKAGHALEFNITVIDSPRLTKRGKMKKLIKTI